MVHPLRTRRTMSYRHFFLPAALGKAILEQQIREFDLAWSQMDLDLACPSWGLVLEVVLSPWSIEFQRPQSCLTKFLRMLLISWRTVILFGVGGRLLLMLLLLCYSKDPLQYHKSQTLSGWRHRVQMGLDRLHQGMTMYGSTYLFS